MEAEAFVQQVLDGHSPSISDLSREDAAMLADRLKAEADRQFSMDPAARMRCADTIIEIGSAVNAPQIVALGTATRGDVFRMLHQDAEAWHMFERAGQLYQEAGDEVGWARTRSSKLLICVEMNSVEAAMRDAEAAREIFQRYQEIDRLIKLDTNKAVVLNYLAEYQAAVDQCQAVLQFMESSGEVDDTKLTIVYYVMGNAHQGLGNLRESLAWYQRVRELWLANDEKLGVALIDLNIINIAQAQGHHKKALQLLHKSIDALAQYLPLDGGKEMMHVVEGYLFLNRFHDARDLARKVVQQRSANHMSFDLAVILLLLAQAETALGNFSEVFLILERAEQIYSHLKAAAWLGTVSFYRVQAALLQGDLHMARQSAHMAAERFRQNGQKIAHLMALLLAIRIEIADGQTEAAQQMARDAQRMSRTFGLPHLSYEAHLLQGQIAEQKGKANWAIHHYQAAAAIMEAIQRSLALTARREFLADKQESVQALVRLNLVLGRTEAAFTALERAKAQVWLGYLSQLDHLRWLRDDPQIQPLIEELGRLREEHHWYYRVAQDQVFREQQHVVMPPAEAAVEASTRERRLRALTEQLYLHSSVEDLAATAVVPVSELQSHLPEDSVMVAYYSDGVHLWAFLLDSENLRVCALPESAAAVEKLLEKWQANINRALRTTPGSADERMLCDYTIVLAKHLYDALIRPFAGHDYKRLVIVPYGALHYLPFHLLHDGKSYLIEQSEVVILPTASLLTRQPPRQQKQAVAIAYSWDERLCFSEDEAQAVVERFGGRVYSEDAAIRAVLTAPPCQILHISAHGQYRMDQPDFSYIQLADGPLYTDDLFQCDLRYELVTLSACETGRSHVAPGDELIGLGRGFLFSGAGALIASLWRVDERLTLELMDIFYQHLDSGASKAAALREAQLALMRAYPGLHPAFWGAFELIGSADPLTLTP